METMSGGGGAELSQLPEGCIANILSCTSPREACRLSLVSTMFKKASESDTVWDKFLPLGYQSLVSGSSAGSPSTCFSSKKQLYMSLCSKPILIDDGRRSLSLEKGSGKRCYMLFARDLMIVWGDNPSYWKWTSHPEASPAEVAELIDVCWLEIRGRISTSLLSSTTVYTAYLVFKSIAGAYGFEYQPVEVTVGVVGSESRKQKVYLDAGRGRLLRRHVGPRRARSRLFGLQRFVPAVEAGARYPEDRADGWLEIELGEFFTVANEEAELEMSLLEVKGGHWKRGIIVQGIEIRPRKVN